METSNFSKKDGTFQPEKIDKKTTLNVVIQPTCVGAQ